jgi:membrane fusion protein (multidrug efflux system)
MRKRMFIVIAAMVVFVAAIGTVKFLQIKAAIAQGQAYRPPPESVTTYVARAEAWPRTLSAIGTVEAVQGVMLSADLPGVVEAIEFESGRAVRAGQVLVRLDTSQEEAQLAAARAQLKLSRLNLDRARKLLDKGVIAQAEYDAQATQLETAEARVGEIQATIARKTIRAPFDGVVGIRKVDLGQYLTAGDPVAPLQTRDPVYVDFALPQHDVGALHVGTAVQVAADSLAVDGVAGRITALNSVVDEATRNIQVQAELRNLGGLLRPGMFVDVAGTRGARDRVITIPASSISYAPYGNSVFVVGQVKSPDGRTYRGVTQHFVKLGGGRGDQVAVLSGLEPGDEVVTSGVFKLRNGAAVIVNNSVQPANDPAPDPEDS